MVPIRSKGPSDEMSAVFDAAAAAAVVGILLPVYPLRNPITANFCKLLLCSRKKIPFLSAARNAAAAEEERPLPFEIPKSDFAWSCEK